MQRNGGGVLYERLSNAEEEIAVLAGQPQGKHFKNQREPMRNNLEHEKVRVVRCCF